jgi:hypothetical protein
MKISLSFIVFRCCASSRFKVQGSKLLALPSEALAKEGCWLLVTGSASHASLFLCANLRFSSVLICEKLFFFAFMPANLNLAAG